LLLWAAGSVARLSAAASELIDDPKNELLLSAASLWKIAIKRALRRDDFQFEVRPLRCGLLNNGYHSAPPASMQSPLKGCRRSTRTRLMVC